MFRLTANRLLPMHSQPGEVFKDCLLEFGPASAKVDIFDAKHEFSASLLRSVPGEQRRIRVAQMQKSRWTWRKPGDNHALQSRIRIMNKLDGPRVAPAAGPVAQLVVLCHGYGSDGNDLIGLAPHWRNYLPHASFVAPNAPERHPMGAGYQWFPLSRIDPDEALRGTEAAAPVLNGFINAELSRLGLTGDKLALVGFSQGTMLSLYAGLRRTPAPAAIVGFSGLLAGADTIPAVKNPPPVLLVHGDADQVVPPQALFMAANALAARGI